MKKILCLLLISFTSAQLIAQSTEISRNWTAFAQSRDASFLKKKTKFKITASGKIVAPDSVSKAGIWARVDNKNAEPNYFFNKDQPFFRGDQWNTYSVEGTMDEKSDKILFGGWSRENGKFYFDNFELWVENDKGQFQKARIENPGFETNVVKNIISSWTEGMDPLRPVRVKEYTISSTDEHTEGKFALLVEGSGIRKDTTNLIGPVKGFTPQIGTLVTMLNNLSLRVERAVITLDQNETDHMLDDKANSIGALIMHLAAAEAYYQVFTFENRDFNEEETKKWGAALDLGENGRMQLKGHEISYYLDIYKEVRKKTIAELAKRNDAWLAEVRPGEDINNHWCWFHVMEHQSSHLGQILMLKKRLPKKEEKVKVDLDH